MDPIGNKSQLKSLKLDPAIYNVPKIQVGFSIPPFGQILAI